MSILSQIILDEDIDHSANIAQKEQARAKMRVDGQIKLPSRQEFRSSLNNFKSRLGNTKTPERFSSNCLSSEVLSPKLTINKGKHTLKLGVRREKTDLDGNQYTATPIGQQPKETQARGVIENLNEAAGMEHQLGKKWDQLVFDKKAVFQSLKSCLN